MVTTITWAEKKESVKWVLDYVADEHRSTSTEVPTRLFYSMGGGSGTPSSRHSWQPTATVKTTTQEYWWNWRVLLCGLFVLSSITVAFVLIWRYEGPKEELQEEATEGGEGEEDTTRSRGFSCDESWRPCLDLIHPTWLLAFRVTAFFLLSVLLIIYVSVEGTQTFYYYTQWTFTLVVFYFALGSILSIRGCRQFLKESNCNQIGHMIRIDEEHGRCFASSAMKTPGASHRRRNAGVWDYVFQIVYQTDAGAVMLTDFVFWLIIVPFLEIKDYDLSLLMVGMHSVNAIFLFGDAALNSLRFPWFRMSYFLIWTASFVLFQWIVHACVTIWWPYPFLDLASQYSPIWYLLVALVHIPCYAIFFFIVKMKHWLLSRCFPYSYRLRNRH